MAITEETRKELIERFEQLIGSTVETHPGMDRLLDFIRKSDFYTAPSSTKFHGAYKGGLLKHSLNVYDLLMEKLARQQNITIGEESKTLYGDYEQSTLVIVALLHDICKTYFYTTELKNQKTYDPEKIKNAQGYQVKHDSNGDFIWETVPAYTVDDKVPYGHGEKSVMMIEEYVKLKPLERYAIRWHMGPYTGQQDWNTFGQACEKYPLIIALFEADLEASRILEVEKDA